MNLLTDRFSLRPLIAAAAMMTILNSCSKSRDTEPEIIPEREYTLSEMRYLMSGSDQIDTSIVTLRDTTLYNTGNAMVTRKFASNLSGLVKTSQFVIDHAATLPADVRLENFHVQLPADLRQQGSFTYTALKVPLTTGVTQVPYKADWADSLVVRIPARASIAVTGEIRAYKISCSFNALISEKTTGQTFPINGTWKGLLRYDNHHTVLTQHPL